MSDFMMVSPEDVNPRPGIAIAVPAASGKSIGILNALSVSK
jgi:hypothetical protein